MNDWLVWSIWTEYPITGHDHTGKPIRTKHPVEMTGPAHTFPTEPEAQFFARQLEAQHPDRTILVDARRHGHRDNPIDPATFKAVLGSLREQLESIGAHAPKGHWHGGPDPCPICGGIRPDLQRHQTKRNTSGQTR